MSDTKIENSCESHFKNNNSASVLLDKSYAGLSTFNYQEVWSEIMKYNPIVIDLFAVISGKVNDIEEIIDDIKITSKLPWY